MHANDTPPTRSGQDTRSGKATYHTGVKGAAPKAMMRLALGSAALQISKEESEFHGRRKEALANAEKRRELLATIAEQRGLAEQALTDLESRHKNGPPHRLWGSICDEDFTAELQRERRSARVHGRGDENKGRGRVQIVP
jgi:hypothetical protein